MCGICGIATTSADPAIPADILSRMCREIVHRGPDDEGLFVADCIGLANRRLSIIDIEGGHQPLANEDGSIWIAYNGEAYNFPEVRDELIGRGHAFKTRTDTETMVHAYEEWGLDFVHHFRGMFAFALWEKKKRRLLLVRDRIGVKPLYYTLLADRTLVFGSELKAILAHPDIKREIEPIALDLFLTLEYVPAPHSIFKNIFKLPAGHYLTYDEGRTTVHKYWDIEPDCPPNESLKGRSLPSLTDELYALLKESVKLRLISDVPLGAFLSGGIDSSTIVGLMRELGASPLRTFSIGFKDSSYNELQYARRIAKLFETQHEEFILEPQALELTGKLFRHLDEPLADFSIFPTYLVSKMARAHVKVILSGDGGDEVFAGYEHYQAQRLSRLPAVAGGAKAAGLITSRIPPGEQKKGAWNKLRRFTQAFDNNKDLRHLRWMMFFSDRLKENLYSDDLKSRLGGIRSIREYEPFGPIYDRLKSCLLYTSDAADE